MLQMQNGDSERVSNLAKTTQLVNGRSDAGPWMLSVCLWSARDTRGLGWWLAGWGRGLCWPWQAPQLSQSRELAAWEQTGTGC